MCGIDVRALVDSGATHNFVASSIVRRAKLRTSKAGELKVTLADGSTTLVREAVYLPVRFSRSLILGVKF